MTKPLIVATALCLIIAVLLVSSFTRSDDLAWFWAEGLAVRETSCDQVKLNPKSDLVFLAETTHGSESIRALNTCLTKYLIAEHSFTRLILEYDFTDVVQLNLYVQGDARVSRDAAFAAFKPSMYNSRSMMALFDWMRSQNQSGKQLSVYGTDNWNVQGLIAGVLAFSEGTPLERCVAKNSADIAVIYVVCKPLFEDLSSEKTKFGKQSFYLQLLSQVLEQYYVNSTFEAQQVVRDRYMYQLFKDIIAQDQAQRSIISMHAQHALPYPTKFGSYLASDGLKKDIYLMSFCAGNVSSFDTPETNRKLITLTLPAPRAKTIEAALCERRIPDRKVSYDIRDLSSSNDGDHASTPPALDLEGAFVVRSSRSLEFALR